LKRLFSPALILLIGLISCSAPPLGHGAREAAILSFDAHGPHDIVHASWQIEGEYVTGAGKVAEFWFQVPDGTHESTISHLLSDCINVSADEECTRPLPCPDGPDYLAGDGEVIKFSMHRLNEGDATDTLTVNFFDN
jgi:hypothetical protein